MGASPASATLAVGAGVAIAVRLMWTGRWRSWATDSPLGGPNALTLLAAVAAACLGTGAGALLPGTLGKLVAAVGVLVIFACLPLVLWTPRWAQPRWLRAMDVPDPLIGVRLTRASSDFGWQSSRVQARVRQRDEEPLATFGVRLVDEPAVPARAGPGRGTVAGELALYRSGIVFSASPDEERLHGAPVLRDVSAERITGVECVKARRLRATVRIDTADGPLVVRCRRARELIAAVEEHALGARAGLPVR